MLKISIEIRTIKFFVHHNSNQRRRYVNMIETNKVPSQLSLDSIDGRDNVFGDGLKEWT
jgi:hypothetical protein